MSQFLAPVREQSVPIAFAVVVALAALFIVGIDQGQAFSIVQGDLAYQQNILHEVVHDARHVAGFPCH